MVLTLQKPVEIPQVLFLDKVGLHARLLFDDRLPWSKPCRSPSRYHSCKSWTRLFDMPVVVQRHVLMVKTVQKTIKVPLSLWQFIDKIVDIPVVVVQRQAPMVLTL